MLFEITIVVSYARSQLPIFNIDQPPPTDVLGEQLTKPGPTEPELAGDNHLREDSISSMSTDGSAKSQLSWNRTTG
jgi:hypothetical protein